jgi:hypothetical protein
MPDGKKERKIKELAQSSWNRRLKPSEVERLLKVKRQKVKSNLDFKSLSDFVNFCENDGDQPFDTTDVFFSVVYLWNGKGYSALKPFCECAEYGGRGNNVDREVHIHPLHVKKR